MSKKIPITPLLNIGFGLLLIIAVCTVLMIGINATRDNTSRLMSRLSGQALTTLHVQIDDFMQPINNQLNYIASLIEEGKLDVYDQQALKAALGGSLSSSTQTYGIAYIDDQYQALVVERDNATTISRNWKKYRRLEPLFSSPNKVSTPVWSDPIYTRSGNRLIPVMRMVYLPDGRKGMLNTAIDIDKLNNYLGKFNTQYISYFMLLGRQKLLAASFPTPELEVNSENPLGDISDLAPHPISRIWSPLAEPNRMIKLSEGQHSHNLRYAGQEWIYIYSEIRDYAEVPIILGISISTQQLREEKNTLYFQIVFSILLLILFICLSWLFTRRIGSRFSEIAHSFEAIKDAHLDQVEPMRGSPVREFDQVANAFNRMTKGLKQTEQMRNLFGQLVPPDIARKMLTQQGKLEPQQENATIFFIDMEGFTALSERLSAPQLLKTLNAFFSMISEELEAEGGIITQFQGDAVLAIFNIPNPQPDHAQRAVNAARRVLSRISSEQFNQQTLRCRIGINSGEVIAGNVGAPNRQNYTVHGDAVNLASRLENLNKEYGTRILIAESTVRQLSNETTREIGKVAIRGKQKEVRVFTLEDIPS